MLLLTILAVLFNELDAYRAALRLHVYLQSPLSHHVRTRPTTITHMI